MLSLFKGRISEKSEIIYEPSQFSFTCLKSFQLYPSFYLAHKKKRKEIFHKSFFASILIQKLIKNYNHVSSILLFLIANK